MPIVDLPRNSLLEQIALRGIPESTSPDQEPQDYLIGPLAAMVGLEPKTIRFYEKAGLIKPKRIGRYRLYRQNDVLVLSAIKKLRQFGVPIAHIRKLLSGDEPASGEDEREEKLRAMLLVRLKQLRSEYATLQDSIGEISRILAVIGTAEEADTAKEESGGGPKATNNQVTTC